MNVIMTQESNAIQLIRDVTVEECPWLPRDFKKDEVVYEYYGHTYGVISPGGIACTEINGETPFYEFPMSAFDWTE